MIRTGKAGIAGTAGNRSVWTGESSSADGRIPFQLDTRRPTHPETRYGGEL
jgi:hypothetical protein